MLSIEPEHATQITANGRTREHNGSLGTHRTTKPDGDGRSNDAAPAVVGLDVALFASYSKENLGDTMSNVVANDTPHKNGG